MRGGVVVDRSGPGRDRGYTWRVTFPSNSGATPGMFCPRGNERKFEPCVLRALLDAADADAATDAAGTLTGLGARHVSMPPSPNVTRS